MHGAAVQAQSPANPSAMHQHVTMTLQTTTRSSAGQQAGIKKNCGHQEQSTPKPHRAPSPLTNTKNCQPPAHATACTDAWPDTACNKTATHTDTHALGRPSPAAGGRASSLPAQVAAVAGRPEQAAVWQVGQPGGDPGVGPDLVAQRVEGDGGLPRELPPRGRAPASRLAQACPCVQAPWSRPSRGLLVGSVDGLSRPLQPFLPFTPFDST